jgi:hypothetical protein
MPRKTISASRFRLFLCSPARPSRLSLLLLLLTALAAPRLHAQDPSQIMQQLTDLQQQMAGATDPCPFMPKLKALINQIANQSPEVYQAMKPSLDLLNSQDDGCKANASDASPEPTATSNANPNPGGKPTGISTGTAAPPSCVYLSPSQPCVPLDQYQQMQAQTKSSGNGICPASGFVPGVMMHPTSDVAVGVPCKPGTPYGPLIATTASGGYTGVTPPDPASAGGSSGSGGTPGSPSSGGSGGCVNLHQFVVIHSQFLTGTGHCGGEVSVHITNNSNVTLDCSFRFHKNGSWDLNEPSGLVIPPGQTLGGESAGAWTCGADTSDIEDACFAKTSTDNNGKPCSEDVAW